MIRYSLFSEFRNKELFGSTFTEAIQKHPKLQRTDRFIEGAKVDGEKIEIANVIGEVITEGKSRGSKPYVSALVELTDGRIEEIDATQEPVDFVSK